METTAQKKKENVSSTLCFRCEHRANFLESGFGPRAECHDINRSVSVCYMYRPVTPVVIKRLKGDRRPLVLNALSCRVQAVQEGVGHLEAKKVKGGIVVYWVPD